MQVRNGLPEPSYTHIFARSRDVGQSAGDNVRPTTSKHSRFEKESSLQLPTLYSTDSRVINTQSKRDLTALRFPQYRSYIEPPLSLYFLSSLSLI